MERGKDEAPASKLQSKATQQTEKLTKEKKKKTFNEGLTGSKLNVVAQNSERYVFFDFSGFRFIDSLGLMSSSLDSLVTNLKDGLHTYNWNDCKERFPHTTKFFEKHYELTDEMKDIILRKGIYPYDWVDSVTKFNSKTFPSQEDFFSQLTQSKCSDEDYKKANDVYKAFKCKTFREYHQLYLRLDVLLLADVLHNFRNTLHKQYGLDPMNQYITLPGYAWDVMLYKTRIHLEQLTDETMYEFFEKQIRGGISMIGLRHAKANNPYLKNYDKSQPNSYLMYGDANALYGSTMMMPLPYQDFKWLTEKQIQSLNKKNLKELKKWVKIDKVIDFLPVEGTPEYVANGKDSNGYTLEVDLEIPEELHDYFNSYPLAVEKMCPTKDMLSGYQRELLGDRKMGTVPKLVPNLLPKKNYILDIRTLIFYLEKGLKLTKIHRGIEYSQKTWMRPFIEMNTKFRTKATNEFEKDLYKLMSNAVFGKTMESVRGRHDFRFQTTQSQLVKATRNPRLKLPLHIYNENLTGAMFYPSRVTLDKAIYCGGAILDMSKTWMAHYWYDYLVKKYKPENLSLCMTDTDSFLFKVQCEDFYKDMKEDSHWYETSNYDKEHWLFSSSNKKKPGLFKDEFAGRPIRESIGLKAKMYSVVGDIEDDEVKTKINGEKVRCITGKGTPKYILKQTSHQIYKDCLLKNENIIREMRRIGSKDHQLYTSVQKKVCGNAFDDKGYIVSDDVETIKYGHYKLKKISE